MRLRLFAVATAMLAVSLLAKADTLASFTAFGYSTIAPDYLGESFTVSGSGSYSSIAFSFYNGTTAFAPGTGYLLSQVYLGAPSGLNSSTPGFIGEVAGSGGAYDFDPSVMLQAGDTYYLYENVLTPTGSITGGTMTGATPAYYFANSNTNFVQDTGFSATFSVTGSSSSVTSTVTPEPSSLALLGTGVLGVVGAARRRFVR